MANFLGGDGFTFLSGAGTGLPIVVNNPYGVFSDSTTQTATLANTEYIVTLNTIELYDNVTLTSSSHINFLVAGVYNVQFSFQLDNTAGGGGGGGGGDAILSIWFKKNGTNIPRSNTQVYLQNNHTTFAGWNYMDYFSAGQFLEMAWSSNKTGIRLLAIGTQSTPTRPATPSVILTANKVG